jgi:hypothetical protein
MAVGSGGEQSLPFAMTVPDVQLDMPITFPTMFM